jgi:polyhydroxybutyrate depolymerase
VKRLYLGSIVLMMCAAAVCNGRTPKGSGALQANLLRIDNVTRDFYHYVPSNLKNPAKLIFVLHGSGMTAKGMQMLSGHEFDRLADRHRDMIIVYPQGYGRYWNDCRGTGTYDAKRLKVDDVAFFVAMINYYIDKFGIDDSNVFATGYSNGGQMCFKLAKERPELFRGIAAVCANLPAGGNDDCAESGKPVSMLVMNGTSDPINPYGGGLVKAGDDKQRGEVVSTSRTMQYLLTLDKGDSTSVKEYPYPDLNTKDKSTAVRYTYNCAQTGKSVVLVKVINGGHIYMNDGFRYWPRMLGNVNKDISAPRVITDFFRSLR